MNKYLDRLRNDFQGNADALIAQSQDLARALKLEQETSEGNERLLRHYVSIGVVDRPSREGRDALYGFRHLVQFVVARRLLAEGFPLAKIAKYTAVVPTDALTAYLDKPDRASEAELLVAAFRSEAPVQSPPVQSSRRPPTPKPPTSVATGMGMVDVMHEMREMEHRVQGQLKDLQRRVNEMVTDVLRGVAVQVQPQVFDPVELKGVVSRLADLMQESAHRFEHMLQKPMQIIEQQMEQQRYLFQEAQKQKDLLENMFGNLLEKQRRELIRFIEDQATRLDESLEMQRRLFKDVSARLGGLESEISRRLTEIDRRVQDLLVPSGSTPTKKEGAL